MPEHFRPNSELNIPEAEHINDVAEHKEMPLEARDILQTVDTIIETHLKFERKNNEGQQALIFKLDVEADLDRLSDQEKKHVESYIGPSKSLKVLKITNERMAQHEFDWQYKAYEVYEALSEEEKETHAAIPKVFFTQNVSVDNDTKDKLNKQNAKLSSESASVIMMEWVNGEDLLTKVFRQHLVDVPAYADIANDPNKDFSSLLFAVSGDFRTKGMDFSSMSPLEQYKKLFHSITKNNREVLTKDQQLQVDNTMKLLHKNGIYHNDLHLRNFLVGPGENGKMHIIDFGRAHGYAKSFETDIKDDFAINLIKEFQPENQKDEILRKSIQNDFDRIIQRNDRSFQFVLNKLSSSESTELIKFLEQEFSQWRYDPWNVKIMAAASQAIYKKDPHKSEMVKAFMREKKNQLMAESQNVIDLL